MSYLSYLFPAGYTGKKRIGGRFIYLLPLCRVQVIVKTRNRFWQYGERLEDFRGGDKFELIVQISDKRGGKCTGKKGFKRFFQRRAPEFHEGCYEIGDITHPPLAMNTVLKEILPR